MKIFFNSSPLISLARLNLLEIFVNSLNEFYLPEVVNDEIKAKQDEAKEYIQCLIDDNKIEIRGTHLIFQTTKRRSRFFLTLEIGFLAG